MRLGTKLLVTVAVISVIVVVLFGGAVYHRLFSEQLELIQESIAQQLKNFDFTLKSFFDEVEGDIQALAEDEMVRSRNDRAFTSFLTADEMTFTYQYSDLEKRIIHILNTYQRTHKHVNSAYMGRENGAFVRSHPREKPTLYDPRQRPWYILAKEHPEEVMKTDAYSSLTTKDINIGVVKALVDGQGKVYGVVGIDVTLANLTAFFLNFKIRPQGKVFLVGRDGTILAAQEDGWQGKKIEEYSPEIVARLIEKDTRGLSVVINKKEHYLFSQKAAEQDWKMVVLVSASDINNRVRRRVLWIVLGFCAGLGLLSAIVLYGLKQFVVSPLSKLTKEIEFISRTVSLERMVDIQSHDEIGVLAKSYNEMVRTLGQSRKSLVESEKQLTQYRDHLEELVKQRTRELQSTLSELAVAKEHAEESDRLKSVFLATMSHELRTPLNSIIGFTGIILQELAGPLNDEQRKQLMMVRDSGRHLLVLINDVLDISKIEAGQMEVQNAPFDVRASIEKVISIAGPLAQKKGISLNIDHDPGVGELISDQRRFEQILLNVLNNAIKFTDHGSATVKTTIITDARPGVSRALRVSVADTGMGIKPEDMSQLFQPFRQINAGMARVHEGTGLGLAICRRLVELLNGELQVSSEWGKGSVFSFILPMA